MPIAYFVLLTVLGHLPYVGARMTTSLFALHLGASESTIGVVMALFAALPVVLSVASGRLIDRTGPRRPILGGFAALAAACALPFAMPHVATLYVSSVLVGLAAMMVQIAMNSVFGAHGKPEDRPMNFAWLAMSFSLSGSLGPLVAGFSIEAFGHAGAFLFLALFPAIGIMLLLARRAPLPRPERAAAAAGHNVLDLLRVRRLRQVFLVSGTMAMGWDLYAFLMPLYGYRIGLAPGTIGVVMATFAAATFIVRLIMPVLMRRLPQWLVITASMGIAGASYTLFPLAGSAGPLMVLSFVLGFGLGGAQPVVMSLLYEAAPRGRQGEAVGVRATLINASQTLIPLGSGALAGALGMSPVFWLLAAALLGGAWYSKSEFASVPRRS